MTDVNDKKFGLSRLPNRRKFLQYAGLSTAYFLNGSKNCHEYDQKGKAGPPKVSDWELQFHDGFEKEKLNSKLWNIGFGWGRTTKSSPTVIRTNNVKLFEDKLNLQIKLNNGRPTAGAVNTRNKATFGPGSYFEAKLKMPDQVGILPAFWAIPNDGAWPPEIDVVELFQNNGSYRDALTSQHTLHYSSSTKPGDEDTHRKITRSYKSDSDLTDSFHVYGCLWTGYKVIHYVDGVPAAEFTDPTVMKALRRGGLFYLLLTIDVIDTVPADPVEFSKEAMTADWVRVWQNAEEEVELKERNC